MKIGIDARASKWYRGTGIGTYTYQLITNLNKYDSLNDYLLFSPDNSFENLNSNFQVNITNSNPSDNFWESVQIPNILSDNNMDIYHVPQNGVGLCNTIDCKKIITLHDIIPLRMPETVSDRYLKIFNNDMPKILESCDGIITVSNFSKNDIAKEFNFPKDKIFVTHLGAEEIYKPLGKTKCKEFLKKAYGINDNFILYVGGFSPRKNILGLIDAYALLPESKRNSTKLVITGKKGFSYDKYLNRASKLKVRDSIIFTDFIPLNHLPYFYNGCEVLVYPSFYEGFGLPPLEAMACGTPVITSNRTSLPEVCHGSAIFIDPSNPENISYEINRVLEDSLLVLSLVNKSLRRSKSFSFKNTALKTIDAYNSIL